MLLPQDFVVKKRHFAIHRLARTGSTQDVVRKAALAGAADGLCCVAAEQTAGRGRLDRSWIAPPGTGLLASVLIRTSPAAASGLPIAAGVAVADALRDLFGLVVGLKWPNDVLVGDGKLAGILVELVPAAGPQTAAVVGLGLNLTVPGFPAGIAGVSLHRLIPTPPDGDAVLDAWLVALDGCCATLEDGGLPALLPRWRRVAVGLGRAVTVATPGGEVTGVALDIADDGALLVETPSGVQRVVAGDVSVHPREGS